jgi:hypothetical protein
MARDWDEVLTQVRALAGFEHLRFMSPGAAPGIINAVRHHTCRPELNEDLLSVAAHGPQPLSYVLRLAG